MDEKTDEPNGGEFYASDGDWCLDFESQERLSARVDNFVRGTEDQLRTVGTWQPTD
jgi:hypothetical protein